MVRKALIVGYLEEKKRKEADQVNQGPHQMETSSKALKVIVA